MNLKKGGYSDSTVGQFLQKEAWTEMAEGGGGLAGG
jgi:hypothetical protein